MRGYKNQPRLFAGISQSPPPDNKTIIQKNAGGRQSLFLDARFELKARDRVCQ